MKGFFFRAIFAVILGFGLLSSQASAADGRPIQWRYAGTGIDTAVDTDGDGQNVGLTQGNGQGTFGNFAIAVTTEFTPTGSCSAPYTVALTLVYSTTVLTFVDHSQLFGIAEDGWICLDRNTGRHYGQVEGNYVGGTGRFEGATGEFTSPFNGVILEPSVGFRSITGTAEGTVSLP